VSQLTLPLSLPGVHRTDTKIFKKKNKNDKNDGKKKAWKGRLSWYGKQDEK
jgi:hypothetical protein